MGLMQTKLVKNALASPRVVAFVKGVVPRLDLRLLKATRGYLNTGMQPVALLKTVGAKSGQLREIATMCLPVDSRLVVVGSNWGGDKDPAWINNLRANPQIDVIFRGYRGPVSVRELEGEERVAMWARLVEFSPQYSEYAVGTKRQLPIMLLEKST